MLFLVGIGLSGEDLSVRAASVLKKCGKLYVDSYTSFIGEDRIKAVEALSGKDAIALSRHDMEENARKLVGEAMSADIAIVAGGDPLVATTHKILAIEAAKQGAAFEIIHSASIATAAKGESGLDFYRFGAVCTVPMWQEHYKPVSFYETIYGNHSNNWHSLMLLDYDSASSSSMPIAEALRILGEAEKSYAKGLISEATKVIAMVSIGMPGSQKLYGTIKAMKAQEFGAGPAVLILPARLESIEIEAMAALNVKTVDE